MEQPITNAEVWCQEVIINTVTRRGKGVEGDPVRRITQVVSKSGELIAEFDPWLTDCSNPNRINKS